MSQFIKSPNYFSRDGNNVLACVVHITDGTKNAVIQTFTNPKTQVSAHYLVCKNGDIIQFVDETLAAWANGRKANSTAQIVLDNIDINPNKLTVSIEHEGFGNENLTEIQYVNSAKLIKEICQRHAISPNRNTVIGHREIYAYKTCPGKINIAKLINLSYNPPQISQIEELKIKISLLQQLLELMRSIVSFNKLGSSENCELSKD